MTEQIRQIADRIRDLREIARLSAETCARELGIPIETYRSYESGEADIPASFLYQIAHKFNAEMSSLLTGEEPRLRVFCVARGAGTTTTRASRTTSSTRRCSRSASRSCPGPSPTPSP